MGIAVAAVRQFGIESDNLRDASNFVSDNYEKNIKVWIDGSKALEGFSKMGALLAQLIERIMPIANELFSDLGEGLLGFADLIKGVRDLFAAPRFIYDWKALKNRGLHFDRVTAIQLFASLADTFKAIEILAKKNVINLGEYAQPLLKPVKWLVDRGVPMGAVGNVFYNLSGISKIFNTFKLLTILLTRTYDSWTKTVEDMARELAKKENVNFDELDGQQQGEYVQRAMDSNRLQRMYYRNRFRIIHAGMGLSLLLFGAMMPLIATAPLLTYVALNGLRGIKRDRIKKEIKALREEQKKIRDQEAWQEQPLLNERSAEIDDEIRSRKERRQQMSRSWIPGYI